MELLQHHSENIFKYPPGETDHLLASWNYSLINEYQEVIRASDLFPPDPVLDIGTGSGRSAAALVQEGFIVVSGDIDRESQEKTRTKLEPLVHGRISYVRIDAHRTGYPDDSFTGIILANTLHECENPAGVIREAARICRNHGKLVVIDFTDHGFEIIGKAFRQTRGVDHNCVNINPHEIKKLLESLFKNVEKLDLPLNHAWIASDKIRKNSCSSPTHNNCFACGRKNPQGLHLNFIREDKNRVTADCIVGEEYQGYPGVVQGGIVSTLLDSAMANCLFHSGIDGMTVKLAVRFHKPVKTNTPMKITAVLNNIKICMYELHAEIIQAGDVKATAEGTFFPGKNATDSRK